MEFITAGSCNVHPTSAPPSYLFGPSPTSLGCICAAATVTTTVPVVCAVDSVYETLRKIQRNCIFEKISYYSKFSLNLQNNTEPYYTFRNSSSRIKN
jgi:hypothetical protein